MRSQPFVSTASGRRFHFLTPSADEVELEDIAHGLAYQCRFNGQTDAFYSVAQHSLLVAELVPPPLRLTALLHDAAEAYVGDIVKPLKNLVPEFEVIERRIAAAVGERFGVELCELPKAVKRADLNALATEKRDLMPRSVEAWPQLQGVAAVPRRIVALGPEAARRAFLERFNALAAPRRRAA